MTSLSKKIALTLAQRVLDNHGATPAEVKQMARTIIMLVTGRPREQ